jgi:hypothetical protein
VYVCICVCIYNIYVTINTVDTCMVYGMFGVESLAVEIIGGENGLEKNA